MKSTKRGSLTLEILIATTMATLFLVGTHELFITQEQTVFNNETRKDMTYILEDLKNDIHTLLTHSLLITPSLTLGSAYTHKEHTTFISPCMRHDMHTLEFTPEYGTPIKKEIVHSMGTSTPTYMSDGWCDPFPPPSFDNPKVIETIDLSAFGAPVDLTITDMIVTSRNNTTYVLLTSTHTDTATPDFWIIELEAMPRLAAMLDIDEGYVWPGHAQGANGLTMHKDMLYVIRNAQYDQLFTITTHTITNPIVSNRLSFTPYGVDPLGSDPQGHAIARYENMLYVGLRTTIGPELFALSLTDPENPRVTGFLESTFNHTINDIASTDTHIFLGTGYDNGEIAIIKKSNLDTNPLSASDVTFFNLPDTEDARSLFSVYKKLFVGRNGSASSLKKDLYVLGIEHPDAPTIISSINANLRSTAALLDVVPQGSRVFLASSHPSKEFHTIAEEATTLEAHGCAPLNLPSTGVALAFIDNTVVIALKEGRVLVIKDQANDACTII